MIKNYKGGKFIASDHSATTSDTDVEGTDFDSKIMELALIEQAVISVYVKGADGGAAGNAEFCFAAYDAEREMWDTEEYLKITIAINGSTAAQKTESVTCAPKKLKLLSIKNGDDAVLTANASYFVKQ